VIKLKKKIQLENFLEKKKAIKIRKSNLIQKLNETK
jgi:hypothetical protein